MSSYKQYLNIGEKSLNSLSRNKLAPIVSSLRAVANKRLNRFKKMGLASPATINREKYESIRGKTLNELRSIYTDLNSFLQMKTSTIKGYKEYLKEVYKKLNEEEPTNEQLDDFIKIQEGDLWKAYNRAKDLGIAHGSNSDIVQKALMEKIKENPYASVNELVESLDINEINQRWLRDYEKAEEEYNRTNLNEPFFKFDL